MTTSCRVAFMAACTLTRRCGRQHVVSVAWISLTVARRIPGDRRFVASAPPRPRYDFEAGGTSASRISSFRRTPTAVVPLKDRQESTRAPPIRRLASSPRADHFVRTGRPARCHAIEDLLRNLHEMKLSSFPLSERLYESADERSGARARRACRRWSRRVLKARAR